MNIITKENFLEILPIISEKIKKGYKIKFEIIDNEDNWETVVDFWDGVNAKEVLDFLEEQDGRKVEKTTN